MDTYDLPESLIEAMNESDKPIRSKFSDKAIIDPQTELTRVKLIDLEKNRTVIVSNQLVFSAQPMSIVETKLIRVLLSHIDDYKIYEDDEGNRSFYTFKLRVKDLSQEFFGRESKTLYTQIQTAALSLQHRSFFYRKGPEQWRSISWVTDIAYDKGDLTIDLNPKIVPFVSGLKSNFSQYSLELLLSFRSKYSIRLYEAIYAKINRDIKLRNSFYNNQETVVEFSVKEVRVYTTTVTKYPKITHFKRRVVDPAVKEISENTDIVIRKYETLAKGSREQNIILFYCYLRQDVNLIPGPSEEVYSEFLSDNAVFNADYIIHVMDVLSLDYQMEDVVKTLELYEGDVKKFNGNFKIALPKATKNILGYINKMMENELEAARQISFEELTKTDNWLTKDLERKFNQVFEAWNEKAYAAMTAAMGSDEPDLFLSFKIANTKTKKAKRSLYLLLQEGFSMNDIMAGMDTAEASIFFLKNFGTLNFFLIPENFKAIINGDYLVDGDDLRAGKQYSY